MKQQILIADDEIQIRNLISATLEHEEYEIFEASNGKDALSIATSTPLDLIFLDMCMPQLDGVGFLNEFNLQSCNKCPIIAITGNADDDTVCQCYDQGVYAVIRKPLRTAEIRALSKRYTGRAKVKNRLKSHLQIIHQIKKVTAPEHRQQGTMAEEMIEALPVPLFFKDDTLSFLVVNKAFEQFTGWSREELLSKTIYDFAPKKVARKIDHMEREILKTGGVQSYGDFFTDSQGEQREVIFYRTTMGNNHCGLLGLIVDVSEYGLSSFSKRLSAHYPHLTQRELQVANLVRIGMTNKEISDQLDISLSTVEFHRNNLRDKLGLKGNRANLSATLMAI